jgi:hypothetical protein
VVEIQTGLGWSVLAVVSRPFGAVITIRPDPIAMLGSPKPAEPGSWSGVVNVELAALPAPEPATRTVMIRAAAASAALRAC